MTLFLLTFCFLQALTQSLCNTSSEANPEVSLRSRNNTSATGPVQTFSGAVTKTTAHSNTTSDPVEHVQAELRRGKELSEEEQIKLAMEISEAEFKAQQSLSPVYPEHSQGCYVQVSSSSDLKRYEKCADGNAETVRTGRAVPKTILHKDEDDRLGTGKGFARSSEHDPDNSVTSALVQKGNEEAVANESVEKDDQLERVLKLSLEVYKESQEVRESPEKTSEGDRKHASNGDDAFVELNLMETKCSGHVIEVNDSQEDTGVQSEVSISPDKAEDEHDLMSVAEAPSNDHMSENCEELKEKSQDLVETENQLQAPRSSNGTARNCAKQMPNMSDFASSSCSNELNDLCQKSSDDCKAPGSSIDLAIPLDSQEPDDDLVEVLEDQATSNRCEPVRQQSCENDYACAIKIQEDLNNNYTREISLTARLGNDKTQSATAAMEDIDDDFAYALKVQDEINSKEQTTQRSSVTVSRVLGSSKTVDDRGAVAMKETSNDDFALAWRIQEELNCKKSSPSYSPVPHFVGSSKTTPHIRAPAKEADDFALAWRMQQQLNNNSEKHGPSSSSTSNILGSPKTGSTATDQLSEYRERQKQRYGAKNDKGNPLPPGLAFRRNVHAIAAGKAVREGITNPGSRTSPKSAGRLRTKTDVRRSTSATNTSRRFQEEELVVLHETPNSRR